jgi:hypothetical protein
MRSRTFTRRAIVAGLAAAGAAALLAAGCLFDSDDGPIYGAVRFQFLRFPSVVAGGAESTNVHTAFLVGGDGCWGVKDLSLEMAGDTIRVSGTTRKGDPNENCPAVMVYGREDFVLPALDPGLYWIEASRLIDTLRVSGSGFTGEYRLVLEEHVLAAGEGCGEVWCAEYKVGLSALPGSVPSGRAIVWADQTEEDPCERGPYSSFDYLASVRRIEAVPQ